MRNYTDENRGILQKPDKARQLLLFDGMELEGQCGVKNVTPTDVDAYIQLQVKDAFIFIESKLRGSEIARGQKLALTSLVDGLCDAKKNAILLHVEHDIEDGDVHCSETIVKECYWEHKWYPQNAEQKCIDFIKKYIEYISKNAPLFVVLDKDTGKTLNSPSQKFLISDDGTLLKFEYNYEKVQKEGKYIINIQGKEIEY